MSASGIEGRDPVTSNGLRRRVRWSRRAAALLLPTGAVALVLGAFLHSAALTVAALVELGLAVLLVLGLLRSRSGNRIAAAVRRASSASVRRPRA